MQTDNSPQLTPCSPVNKHLLNVSVFTMEWAKVEEESKASMEWSFILLRGFLGVCVFMVEGERNATAHMAYARTYARTYACSYACGHRVRTYIRISIYRTPCAHTRTLYAACARTHRNGYYVMRHTRMWHGRCRVSHATSHAPYACAACASCICKRTRCCTGRTRACAAICVLVFVHIEIKDACPSSSWPFFSVLAVRVV